MLPPSPFPWTIIYNIYRTVVNAVYTYIIYISILYYIYTCLYSMAMGVAFCKLCKLDSRQTLYGLLTLGYFTSLPGKINMCMINSKNVDRWGTANGWRELRLATMVILLLLLFFFPRTSIYTKNTLTAYVQVVVIASNKGHRQFMNIIIISTYIIYNMYDWCKVLCIFNVLHIK